MLGPLWRSPNCVHFLILPRLRRGVEEVGQMSVMLAVRLAKGVNCCEPVVHGSAYLFMEEHVSIKCFSSSGSIATVKVLYTGRSFLKFSVFFN